MKFQLAIFSALIACCAAKSTVDMSAVDLSVDIPANSKLGSDILSKARRVNENEEEQYTWQNDYSIRFHSCHTLHLFGGDGAEEQEEGSNPVGNQHLVKFKLCPSNTDCSQCKKGGEYVVKMREFLEVYLETKKELEEAQCATVEENCVCDYYDGDDDACMAQCYADAGLDFCVEDEDFDVADYLECAPAPFYVEDTFERYIGPYCSTNGNGIQLGVFNDLCVTRVDDDVYSNNMYGVELPYSQSSLVNRDCISCKEVDENEDNNQNNNNYYEAADPIELCQQLYMESAKCEKKMSGKSDPDTGSCQYINRVIPSLERLYKNGGSGLAGVAGGNGATILAWIFFVTTVAASAGLFYFFNLSKRTNVDLSSNGGNGIL